MAFDTTDPLADPQYAGLQQYRDPVPTQDPVVGTLDDPVVGQLDGPQSQVFRAQGYGPNAGDPPTRATTYGPLGPLGDEDLAVSPNMLDRFPLRSRADIVDPRTGQTVFANQRVADYSYISEGRPNYNTFEQRHVKDMGHMILRPHVQTADPVVGKLDAAQQAPVPSQQAPATAPTGTLPFDPSDPTGEARRGTMAGEGPGTHGRPEDPIVGQLDQSQQEKAAPRAELVTQQGQNDPTVGKLGQSEEKGFDLGRSIRNIWDVANANVAAMRYGTAQATATEPLGPNDPYNQQIQEVQTSPDLNDQQKQAAIAALKKRQQQEQDRAQLEVQPAQEQMRQAQQQVAQEKPNVVESTIGGTLPYLASGFAGPLGPFAAATQATAQAYGQTLDDAANLAKQQHPDWTDGRIMVEANKAASESSKASGESMLALGLVDLPVAGPLISRIAAKIGIGGATMEIANVYAQVQRNIALKSTVNPKQDIYDGLRDLDFHLQNLVTGGAYGLPHGLGEIGRGERGVVRVAPSGEEIAPTAKAPVEEGPLPVSDQGQPRIPRVIAPVQPGQKAAPVEENGESVNVEVPNEQRPEQVSAPVKQAPETTAAQKPAVVPNELVAQTHERRVPEAQPEQAPQVLPAWKDLSREERAAQTTEVLCRGRRH